MNAVKVPAGRAQVKTFPEAFRAVFNEPPEPLFGKSA
jgi:hypothetical protein